MYYLLLYALAMEKNRPSFVNKLESGFETDPEKIWIQRVDPSKSLSLNGENFRRSKSKNVCLYKNLNTTSIKEQVIHFSIFTIFLN
jgi:hypothetical protein